MFPLQEVLLGLVGGAAFVAAARALDLERLLFAGVLLVASLAYVAFGTTSQSGSGLVWELAGSLAFAVFGGLGLVSSMWFLAAGWVLHMGWDLILPAVADVSYMPEWYVPVCVAFDGIVAAYIAVRARSGAAGFVERL